MGLVGFVFNNEYLMHRGTGEQEFSLRGKQHGTVSGLAFSNGGLWFC